VTNVVDGDPVDLSDGREIRVLGVDAPEKGQCGFEEASEFGCATLLNKQVEVTPDPDPGRTVDRHGRSLLYLSTWAWITPTS
jgi:endonuclease YncB( thermonuclease family)